MVKGSDISLLLLVSINVLFIATSTAQDDVEPFAHSVFMDSDKTFLLKWTPFKDYIVMEMEAKTLGYLGIGFSPNGGMKDSDIIIGFIDEGGRPHLTDRFATGQSSPIVDDVQDVELLSARRNSTHTSIRFRRPWASCDTAKDRPISGDTVRVIYAYNSAPPNPTEDTLPYHSKRGVRSLFLAEPKPSREAAALVKESDVKHWDLLAPDVSLPDDLSTLYWCTMHKVPDTNIKHHYIGYEPIFQKGNEQFVHHAVVYECHMENSSEVLEPWVEHPGAQCYSPNMPVSWMRCGTPLLAWAVGSEGVMLPADVGFPLGEEHEGGTYFMMEMHYNNPDKVAGITDKSGIRLFYTNKLRPYDAGFMQIGHSVGPLQIIAPNTPDYELVGHCSSGCTDAAFPQGGIKMFGGFLHSHLRGTRLALRHIRDKKELPPILEDRSYDFNYQQERILPELREVWPGDRLLMECHYNTEKDAVPVFGGFGTEEEMCIAFMMYYPKVKLSECYSRPKVLNFMSTFGITELYDQERVIRQNAAPSFAEESINVEQEKALREMLKGKKAGSSGIKMRMADMFKYVIVKQPLALQNKSLLEILEDPKTWSSNSDIPKKLHDATMKGSHQVSCLARGRKAITTVQKEESLDFEVFQPIKGSCHAKLAPLENDDDDNAAPAVPEYVSLIVASAMVTTLRLLG